MYKIYALRWNKYFGLYMVGLTSFFLSAFQSPLTSTNQNVQRNYTYLPERNMEDNSSPKNVTRIGLEPTSMTEKVKVI